MPPKYEQRPPLSMTDALAAVRAAYRIGIMDMLLRNPRLHPTVRERLEREREYRLAILRLAGLTDTSFEDVA
jgi:Mrp family chromosome partitioning ATPase